MLLFQATIAAAHWNSYGFEHVCTLISLAILAAIAVATRLSFRGGIPASWGQPVWAITASAILLNILVDHVVEFGRPVGVFRGGVTAVMVGSSFLLFHPYWFLLVMFAALGVPLVALVSDQGAQAFLGLALNTGAAAVAWTLRSREIADLHARRTAEFGEDQRKRSFAATALRSQTGVLEGAGQQAPGLLVYDLGQVVDCSEALLTLVERKRDELANLDLRDLFAERDQRVVAAELAYPSDKPVSVSIMTAEGLDVAVRLTAHALDWQGRKLTLVSVTDLRTENAWRIQAETDPLTGLPNRLRFDSALEQAVRRFQQNRVDPFGLLFLDLENLKRINDTFTHAAGDQVLRAVAHRLTHVVRPGDVAARLSGDEFAVIVHGVADAAAIETISARIRRAVENPVKFGAVDLPCSISMGAAIAGIDDDDAEKFLERADRAMYADKQKRRSAGAS